MKISSDLEFRAGSPILSQTASFPDNPKIGTFIFRNDGLYIYAKNYATGDLEWQMVFDLSRRYSTYIHTQSTASTTWTITHNLNSKNLSVLIYDEESVRQIQSGLTYVDNNIIRLTFTEAISGKAMISTHVQSESGSSGSGESYTKQEIDELLEELRAPATSFALGMVKPQTGASDGLTVDSQGNLSASPVMTLASNSVQLTGDQNINGTKVFLSSPVVPAPDSNDNSTKVPNTSWVQTNAISVANQASSAATNAQQNAQAANTNAENALEAAEEAKELAKAQSGTLRNYIAKGRERKGYPDFLTKHYPLDLACEYTQYEGKMGTVSSSTQYSNDYRATAPLVNQNTNANSGWITQNTVKDGWWQYTFRGENPPVVTAFTYWCRNADTGTSIQEILIQGRNSDTEDWEIIFQNYYYNPENGEIPAKYGVENANTNIYSGRTYWFEYNQTAYKQIRISFNRNYGSAYTGFQRIRLWTTDVKGLDRYDFAIYADEKTPFEAYIAQGLDEYGKAKNHRVRLDSSVVINSHMLDEMAINELYLVPAEADGSLPSYCNAKYAQKINSDTYIYSDPRKIHYGNIGDIEAECYAILQHQVEETKALDGSLKYPNLGFYNFVWQTGSGTSAVEVHASEQFRGCKAGYYFRGTAGYPWLSPNMNLLATPTQEMLGKTYDSNFTMEIDVKWTGAAPSTTNNYFIIFDRGYGAAPALAYKNSTKTLCIYSLNGVNNWIVAAPADLSDGQWHSIAFSLNQGWLYLHLDGKCISKCRNMSVRAGTYNYYMLGRWIHSNANPWFGYLSNFRLTQGSALYGARDYSVPNKFYTTLIPHKTLWYDQGEGCVKEYDASTETWKKTPMLPIGRVQTSFLENTSTGDALGNSHNYSTNGKQSKYCWGSEDDGHYSDRGGWGLLSTGSYGRYLYATPSDTNEHYAIIKLADYDSRDRKASDMFAKACPKVKTLRMFPETSDHAIEFRFPALFVLEGSNDNGASWDVLLDRSEFVEEGRTMYVPALTSGVRPTHLPGWNDYEVNANKAYGWYRMRFPYAAGTRYAQNYRSCGIFLIWENARPEIEEIMSYSIGDVWISPPIRVVTGTWNNIPVPWNNNLWLVDGYVQEVADYNGKWRKLGQANSYSGGSWSPNSSGSVSNYYRGEELYQDANNVYVQIHSQHLSLMTPAGDVNAASTYGWIRIVAKRLGV